LIQVNVRTILTIKKILGQGELELPVPKGSTLNDLLSSMADKWGKEFSSLLFDSDGRIFSHIRLMVNGRDVAFLDNKIDTVLQERDEILILPPVAGG